MGVMGKVVAEDVAVVAEAAVAVSVVGET